MAQGRNGVFTNGNRSIGNWQLESIYMKNVEYEGGYGSLHYRRRKWMVIFVVSFRSIRPRRVQAPTSTLGPFDKQL